MAGYLPSEPTDRMKAVARLRRFWQWLSSPHVVLSIIMLLVMFYMVIIPLYRMLMTTITVSESDLRVLKEAEVGQFTWYHWLRMLTSKIATIMTYEPLLHSLTISLGATMLALAIGGFMAWMVVRTDVPGKGIINTLATIPYIMPSWTIAMAWTVLFKNQKSGGTPGFLEFITGAPTPDWLAYGPFPIIVSSALHYYTFFFLFVSAALLSIDSSLEEAGELAGAGTLAHHAQNHLPAGDPGDCFRLHHDFFQNHGHIRWTKCFGCTGASTTRFPPCCAPIQGLEIMEMVLSWQLF